MDTTEFTADFALLHPAGHLTYSHRGPGESIAGAIRRHLPNLSTQNLGRLRMWFIDYFTPDLADNPLADYVISHLSYRHATGWLGPVALTLEEDDCLGDVSPLTPEVRATLDELAQSRTVER